MLFFHQSPVMQYAATMRSHSFGMMLTRAQTSNSIPLRHRGILTPLAIAADQMLPSTSETASASRTATTFDIALPTRAPVNA